MSISSLEWLNGKVKFLDQTKLPQHEKYIITSDYRVIIEAIRKLSIRGAPLIGIAAAYGIALSAIEFQKRRNNSFIQELKKVIKEFKKTRPTAVNLFWALERIEKLIDLNKNKLTVEEIIQEAINIHNEDKLRCDAIGFIGNQLIPDKANILTHCNTGALATGGEGTALSIIKYSHRSGKKIHIFVDETRPLLQGARLTIWELKKNGIDCTLITDNTAAFLMQQKKVDLIITGADRITLKGFTANKIGTYNLAVLAHYHNIPFYIAAPTSTIDFNISEPEQIKIEERNPDEVKRILKTYISPANTKVYNPSFDITPPELISGIITEHKIHCPPYVNEFKNLRKLYDANS